MPVTTSSVATARVRPQARAHGLPQMVGLDGLRAVAVAAVVLYHADADWLPGGFLGVDVFFVLSGFLITSLLLIELERTGRIRFGQFYLRRARRLLPALLAVLAVTGVLVATVAFDVAAAYRRDLPGALLYYSNWSSILTDASYFEFIGRPTMLAHLWSLAVEEQFYLVWPLICLALYRWGGARRVGQAALTGALLSTLAMAVGSFVSGMPLEADPSRLYYGSDTHSMGILLGAALAVVWRPGRTSPVLRAQARWVITAAGVLGLAMLGWAFTTLGEYSTFLYRGGFLCVAGMSALVVAAASHRGVPFGRWLGNRPMRWLGLRSYGIYLWHWPLFLVTRPGVDIPLDGLHGAGDAADPAAGRGRAELPLPGAARATGRTGPALGARSPPRRQPAVSGAAVRRQCGRRSSSLGSAVRVAGSSPPSDSAVAALGAPEGTATLEAPLERDLARLEAATAEAAGSGAPPAGGGSATAGARRTKVSAFGDSVLLGAAPTLALRTFDIDLHAGVGRQAEEVESSIRTVTKAGDLRRRVLIHTGSNGIVTADELRGMFDAAKSADRVVISTVRVPRPWATPNNNAIRKVAAEYDNVVVADWAEASDGHRGYFDKDGVHLTAQGAQRYNAVIAAAFGVPVEPT